MTTLQIADLLRLPRRKEIDRRLIPENLYCEETQLFLDGIHAQVETLAKQRDELNRVLPGRTEIHNRQFQAELVKLAGEFLEYLRGGPDGPTL